MKKVAAIILTVASLFIIFLSFDGPFLLLAFLMTGAVPGTSLSLSSSVMLAVSLSLVIYILMRASNSGLPQDLRED